MKSRRGNGKISASGGNGLGGGGGGRIGLDVFGRHDEAEILAHGGFVFHLCTIFLLVFAGMVSIIYLLMDPTALVSNSALLSYCIGSCAHLEEEMALILSMILLISAFMRFLLANISAIDDIIYCCKLFNVFLILAGGRSFGCPENSGGAGTLFESVLKSLIVNNHNLTTHTDTVFLESPNPPLWTNIFVTNHAKVSLPLLWSRVQVSGASFFIRKPTQCLSLFISCYT